jgi:tetratricopeptide (TPR) repeat protein
MRILVGHSPAFLFLLLLLPTSCTPTDQLMFAQGEEQLQHRMYAQAYESFSQVITLLPTSAEAYYNRALAAIGMDKFKEALADLTEAVRLDPGNLDARWMRFKLWSEQRAYMREDTAFSPVVRPLKSNMESALTVFMRNELDAILEYAPTDIWALNERGRLEHECADYDAALADYNKALVLCDTCTWLMYNKALTLKASFQCQEAVQLLNTLLEIDNSDGEAWLMLGECYFELARRTKACEAFRRSMQVGVAAAEERYKALCR